VGKRNGIIRHKNMFHFNFYPNKVRRLTRQVRKEREFHWNQGWQYAIDYAFLQLVSWFQQQTFLSPFFKVLNKICDGTYVGKY